ncbi:hypothetical protein ACFL6U_15805 [Planctomycetota bacterium]
MKILTAMFLACTMMVTYSHISLPVVMANELVNYHEVIPDFQVNENHGSASQVAAAAAIDDAGNFIIACQDNRNGDWDIYVQQFTSNGNSLGDAFKVNDDEGVASQAFPAIASDAQGNFVITWTDERLLEDNDIFLQIYTHEGNRFGSDVRVNDDVGEALQRNSVVAITPEGGFMVVWEDRRSSSSSIYAQRFSQHGLALGGNIMISDAQSCSDPTIAATPEGNYLIAWVDYRDGNLNVYAQWLTGEGQAAGNAFKVNDDTGKGRHFYPSMATSQAGQVVITWKDERTGSNIYAQRYSSMGLALGANFKVNDNTSGTSTNNPTVCVAGDGTFMIAWQAAVGSVYNVYGQRFTVNGTPVGANIKLNDDLGDQWQLAPSLAANTQGDVIVAWKDTRLLNDEIYAQRYVNDGSPVGANFRAFDDAGGSWISLPSMAVDPNNRFVIAWEDKRNGLADIYARSYASDGNALTDDFKVNDDVGIAHHVNACVATDEKGDFVIVWRDTRDNGDADIYAQRYARDATALGSNFRVNDDTGGVTQYYPSVAIGLDSEFLVTWQDNRNGNKDIYAQLYTGTGTPLGSNFMVNDDPCDAQQERPSVSSDQVGHYWIVWEDRRNDERDVFVQPLSMEGVALGSNFQLDDDAGIGSQYKPVIAAWGNGNFVAAWEDYRDSNDAIYGCRYAGDGSVSSANFKVSDDVGDAYMGDPSVAVGYQGEFVVAWHDERNGDYDVYLQSYVHDGSAYGPNVRLSNTGHKTQWYPDIKLRNGLIFGTWSDSRAGGTGFDIWANVKAMGITIE